MKTYNEFHGEIEIKNIGKRLREIVKTEKKSFKIVTGYGSTSGIRESYNAAIKSLNKMYKEDIIKCFLTYDMIHMINKNSTIETTTKQKYINQIKNDSDFKNPGVIFIFV